MAILCCAFLNLTFLHHLVLNQFEKLARDKSFMCAEALGYFVFLDNLKVYIKLDRLIACKPFASAVIYYLCTL